MMNIWNHYLNSTNVLYRASAGADIILLQRDPSTATTVKDKVRALGRKCDSYACDLGQKEQLREIIPAICERDGRNVDILVNCGGLQHRSPAVDFAEDKWDEVGLLYRDPVLILKGSLISIRKSTGHPSQPNSLLHPRPLPRQTLALIPIPIPSPSAAEPHPHQAQNHQHRLRPHLQRQPQRLRLRRHQRRYRPAHQSPQQRVDGAGHLCERAGAGLYRDRSDGGDSQ